MTGTASTLQIVRTVKDLRTAMAAWRNDGLTAGLVPTMGALHDGHFSLADRSVADNDNTCATLFVNPKQFRPDEDFDVYPRDEAGDAAALAERGVDVLFAPGVEEMYPEGSTTAVSVPGIGDILEGECRPGFFTGVATVVSKLLIQSLPDKAYFGEKDYQQLCVIQRMTADLDIPVEIIGCPIIREDDGLALSSRNAYLSDEERAIAPVLNASLVHVAEALNAGGDVAAAEADAAQQVLEAGFKSVDYITARHPLSLEPVTDLSAGARVLGAAWLGKTRLIDNIGAAQG